MSLLITLNYGNNKWKKFNSNKGKKNKKTPKFGEDGDVFNSANIMGTKSKFTTKFSHEV